MNRDDLYEALLDLLHKEGGSPDLSDADFDVMVEMVRALADHMAQAPR